MTSKFDASNRDNGPLNHIQALFLSRQVCPRPGFYPVSHHQARPVFHGQVRLLVCPNQFPPFLLKVSVLVCRE